MVGTAAARQAVPTMNSENPPNDNDPTPEPERPAAGEQPTTGKPPATGEQTTTGEPPTTGERPTTGEQPAAAEQATASQAAAQAGPRRLYRSRGDRVIGGVCGGLARYLNVDPVIVRVVAVALIFAGGAGLFLYLAAFLLVPDEGEGGQPGDPPKRGLVVAGAIALAIAIGVLLPFHGGWWGGWSLLPLGLVAVAGLLVWRLATGERPQGDARAVVRAIALGIALIVVCVVLAFGAAWAAAAGGNTAVAGIVIAAGLALVAGAFLDGRARWLILPALAVALPAGVVAAADIDVTGGHGERIYRPASSNDVRSAYRLGAGKLVVDLRGAHLTPGDHRVKLRLGVGEVQLVVPRGVCVSTDSHLGAGGVQVFDRDGGGIDVDWQDERRAPTGTPRVVVDADVGIGAFSVHHEPDQSWADMPSLPGNEACA
jgi:phage shock protein PspC (stress-responsive transcriptional regulator)